MQKYAEILGGICISILQQRSSSGKLSNRTIIAGRKENQLQQQQQLPCQATINVALNMLPRRIAWNMLPGSSSNKYNCLCNSYIPNKLYDRIGLSIKRYALKSHVKVIRKHCLWMPAMQLNIYLWQGNASGLIIMCTVLRKFHIHTSQHVANELSA